MNEANPHPPHYDEPILYEICFHGHLDIDWALWFDEFTILLEASGCTRLIGPIVDQAALHGLLKKVRNLGLPLLSVNPYSDLNERLSKKEKGMD